MSSTSITLITPTDRPWNESVGVGGGIDRQETRTGCVRITLSNLQTAGGSMAGDVQYRPDENGRILWLEGRVRTSNASSASCFFGFTDANNDTVIIEDEDGNLNTVPSDAAGLLLEGEQLQRFQVVSVRGDNDGPQVDFNEINIANNEWHVLRIEVNTEGDVKCAVDGFYSDWQRGILDPTKEYCWAFSADGRGTAYNVEIDYLELQASREE